MSVDWKPYHNFCFLSPFSRQFWNKEWCRVYWRTLASGTPKF